MALVVVIMGNQTSKTFSEGEEKFMEKFVPGSSNYLGHWCKKYGFEGQLVEGQCKMVERLIVSTAGKTGKAKQRQELQLAVGKLWLKQAQKRKEACNAKRAALQTVVVKPEDETGRSALVDQKDVGFSARRRSGLSAIK